MKRVGPALVFVLATAGCGGSGSEPTGPGEGSLVVAASTTGADPDPDGYTLALDGGAPLALADNGTDTLPASAGAHTATLAGIAANCALSGANPRAIDLAGAGTTSVQFDVVCAASPGSIRVSIATSGEDLDADGYVVEIDGSSTDTVPIQDTRQFDAPPGNHQVDLENVAPNCTVGPDTARVVVHDAETAEADFTVACQATPAPGRDMAIVWDRDIYLLSADGTKFINLTSHPVSTQAAWSPDGRKIAFWSSRSGIGHIYVMNPDGSGVTQLTGGDFEDGPSWSPDGAKIAYSNGQHVYVMNADGSQPTQLTHGSFEVAPKWSPRGTKIAFTGGLTDLDVFVMNPDGSGITQLTTTVGEDDALGWTPDGSKILFVGDHAGIVGVYTMSPGGTGVTQVDLGNGELDVFPVWSPDASRIAFISQRSGTPQLYLINPDGSGQVQLTVGSGGAESVAWRP